MERKLKLEELAGYLPYGLNGIFTLSDVVNLSDGQKDEVREKALTQDNVSFFLVYCKPLLLPLSEYNGKRNLFGLLDRDCTYIANILYNGNFSMPILDRLSYNGTVILLKHHFDVFGLLECNLAIDKTTYKGV